MRQNQNDHFVYDRCIEVWMHHTKLNLLFLQKSVRRRFFFFLRVVPCPFSLLGKYEWKLPICPNAVNYGSTERPCIICFIPFLFSREHTVAFSCFRHSKSCFLANTTLEFFCVLDITCRFFFVVLEAAKSLARSHSIMDEHNPFVLWSGTPSSCGSYVRLTTSTSVSDTRPS